MVTPYMVESSNTVASDMYFVNDNALDGFTVSALPVNLVGESRVPSNIFQAFVLTAASIDVSFVGRVDVSSGYFGASYHLSGVDVASFDNAVNNFNYVDNTLNAITSDLFSGINMIYFPQDSSFSTFKKPNSNSSSNFIAMSHRMNIYGRTLPSSTLSPKSVLVEVTKVYATLPQPGYEDVMTAHTSINEISEKEMNSVHDFVKESGFGIRTLKDTHSINKFLSMVPLDQKEVLKGTENMTPNERRQEIVSKLKNFNAPLTFIDLKSLDK